MKITILNGSLGGASGNTARLIQRMLSSLDADVRVIHLAQTNRVNVEILRESDAFVFASGTYWDSWGSPLQKFLEDHTDLEASDVWLGKPAAVLVTMHSVGGKGVLSRLQGVLNTLGLSLPPMSGIAYSLAGQLAGGSEWSEDFWQLDDVERIARNLLVAAQARGQTPYEAWPVDRKDPRRLWLGPV